VTWAFKTRTPNPTDGSLSIITEWQVKNCRDHLQSRCCVDRVQVQPASWYLISQWLCSLSLAKGLTVLVIAWMTHFYTLEPVLWLKGYSPALYMARCTRAQERFRLIKDGHLPQEWGKETWDFKRICTGFVVPQGQCLGDRQRRTAWWARHSKDTANDHLVQTCLYWVNKSTTFCNRPTCSKGRQEKMSL